MVERIANLITATLVQRGIINDNINIYNFGFKLLIPYIIECSIVLLIATFTNNLMYAVCYTFLFTRTRSITGGYHSSTYLGCVVFYIVFYQLSTIIALNTPFKIQLLLYAISMVFLLYITPVIHPNKSNCPPDKLKMKKKLIKLIFVEVLCLFLSFNVTDKVSKAITSTTIVVFVLALLQVVINIGRRLHYEEND